MNARILNITDSSHLTSAVYFPDTNTLYVKFKSGSVYQYDNVHPALFGRLAAAESVGHEFAESIRFNPAITYTLVDGMPGGHDE